MCYAISMCADNAIVCKIERYILSRKALGMECKKKPLTYHLHGLLIYSIGNKQPLNLVKKKKGST